MKNARFNLLLFVGAFTAKTAYDAWLKSHDKITPETKPRSHFYITFAYKLITKGCLIPLFTQQLPSKALRYGIVSGAILSISLEASDRISSHMSGNCCKKSFHFTDFENHPDKFQYIRDLLIKTVGECVRKYIEPERVSICNPTHYLLCIGAFTVEHFTTALLSFNKKEFKIYPLKTYATAFIKPLPKALIVKAMSELGEFAEELADILPDELIAV